MVQVQDVVEHVKPSREEKLPLDTNG